MAEITLIRHEHDISLIRPQREIITRLERGPRGLPGLDANVSYTHAQSTPATTWTINHNLGFRPAIELLDSGGAEFDADIIHLSINTAQVFLTVPLTGTARCN